ncbi:MAG: YggS family pyridoxal phosphate-dependent enzyme, partial [Pseudomonadota bacterium]
MSLPDVTSRIEAACRTAGRSAAEVSLIAVSKVQPPDRVEAVLAAGHRVFGENRVQEAQGKWPAWRAAHDGVELHLLGPLQSNKARAAGEL